MTRAILDQVIGWYGAAAILLAYALSSFKVISQQTILYQVLNGTGAAGIVYVSLLKKAYQPAALNIVWLLIAAIVLVRLLQRPQTSMRC